MRHLAAGLMILALTCAALVVMSWTVPGTPSLGADFMLGTIVALMSAGALVWVTW